MRVGISSRGNSWVSLGCLGMLIVGPFLLCGYVLVLGVKVLVLLGVGLVRLAGVLVAGVRQACVAAQVRRSLR